MPGCAKPIAPYQRLTTKTRGQRRGIVNCDGRTKAGRLLKNTRLTLLEFLGPNVTAPQKSLVERIAWLELRLATFDSKIAAGTFTNHDEAVYNSCVNSLKRLYQALGINKPHPNFAELLK